jgi:hypothetical protein
LLQDIRYRGANPVNKQMKTNIMKISRLLFILFFLLPLSFYGQKSMTGLWTGELSNDSTLPSKRDDKSFEIALTQYKQNVYGYSRRTFIVNDTLYYVVKRMKGKVNGNECKVVEDEYLTHNFPGTPDKGVKVTYTFHLSEEDSSWRLDGEWTTNKVRRNYYSIGGTVKMKEEKDLDKSTIFPHLEELKLAGDVPFYAEAKQAKETKSIAVNTKKETPPPPVKIQNETSAKQEAKEKPAPAVAKTEIKKEEPVAVIKPAVPETKKQETIAISNKSAEEKKPIVTETKIPEPKKEDVTATVVSESKKTDPPVVVNQPPVAETKKQEIAAVNKAAEEKKTPATIETKPQEVVKKQEIAAVNKPVEEKKTPAAIEAKPQEVVRKQENPPAVLQQKKAEPIAAISNPVIIAPAAAVRIKERKSTPPQEVVFKSDSLQLALYDNGEVDGDTVSVLLNGELMLVKQGLKASAIKKTIYIQPGQEEMTLVLYAENLGKYPPNTGLLVVYDGDDRYQVRFSADLQQNATIIFRKKK